MQCQAVQDIERTEHFQDVPQAAPVFAVKEDTTAQVLAKLLDRLEALEAKVKDAPAPKPNNPRGCFECESVRHLARDCPHRRQDHPNKK